MGSPSHKHAVPYTPSSVIFTILSPEGAFHLHISYYLISRGMKSMFSDDSARVGTYDTFYGSVRWVRSLGTLVRSLGGGYVRWVRWVRYGGYCGYGTVGTVVRYGGYVQWVRGTVWWVRWVRYGGYSGYDTVGTVVRYGGTGTRPPYPPYRTHRTYPPYRTHCTHRTVPPNLPAIAGIPCYSEEFPC